MIRLMTRVPQYVNIIGFDGRVIAEILTWYKYRLIKRLEFDIEHQHQDL